MSFRRAPPPLRCCEIHRTNHTFRGVVVPAGEHDVVFEYRPGALYLGLYLYVAVLVSLAAYAAFLLIRSRRARSPEAPA